MTFTGLPIDGAWEMSLVRHEDERGYFTRFWSAGEMAARSLETALDQCSLASNRLAGTVRGMHYQTAPREETKVVRCVRGAMFDVLVDLRPGSPTFRAWCGRELTAENGRALYVPRGVAHGYQTLTDSTDVLYLITAEYDPSLARGVRWNDPAFGIQWPMSPTAISERDRTYPDFDQ